MREAVRGNLKIAFDIHMEATPQPCVWLAPLEVS